MRFHVSTRPRPAPARTGPKPIPLEQRLWSRVDKTDSCWLWTGPRLPHGYGQLTIGIQLGGARRKVYAHRLSWELAFGPIPDGLKVLHNCPNGDNPTCVRPDHLWLGTQQNNVADMIAKGRANHARGAVHFLSKLTPSDVQAIRERWARDGVNFKRSGLTRKSLAAEYHVNSSTIARIIHGDHWSLR